MVMPRNHSWVLLAVFLCVIGLLPGAGRAEDAFNQAWDIGWEISSIEYEEPDIMKQDGVMNGIAASFSHHQDVLARLEARYSWGSVDYSSNGTGDMNDIDDYAWEMRFLLGRDVYHSGDAFITPYVGFGYRYLNDNSQGRLTTTGYLGYERESNYYYSPIGIWASKRVAKPWVVGLILEYDIFWRGVQRSNLSGAISGLSDVENDQNDGYGYRVSVQAIRESSGYALFIEPFVRYWDIDRSENAHITYSGIIVGYGYEPANTSLEYGLKMGAYF